MADPIEQFSEWLAAAGADTRIAEPTAMTLATATVDGAPSARIVLLKEHGVQGFAFVTNLESRKGSELAANPQAALCFYWMPLGRQVRVEGRVERADDFAARYFATRPRDRQIGAWASQQSWPLDARETLDARVAEMEAKFPNAVPKPPFWSAWRLVPERIEFWEQSDARLHARELYTREGAAWRHGLLYP